MADPSFAKAAAKLAEDPPNAPAPTGGLGLVLDPKAQIPLNAQSNIPRCRVYNSANIALTTATTTPITFDSERYDSNECHSLTANTSRLTCNTAGLYRITGNLAFAANAVGVRIVALRLNGATVLAEVTGLGFAGASNEWSLSTEYMLAVGDYVELTGFQNSGGNLNALTAANYSPELSITWTGLSL